MKKHKIIGGGLLITFLTYSLLSLSFSHKVVESIIFFPIDPTIQMDLARTTLDLMKEEKEEKYIVHWEVESHTSDTVYLRQDISLLFEDGRLSAVISDWKGNSSELTQYATYSGKDSSRFLALTFHHGEIHHPDKTITSTHKMSKDHLYVIDSAFSALQSFKDVQSDEQKEWKAVLDKISEKQSEYYFEKALDYFAIPIHNYDLYSLEEIIELQEVGLPGVDTNQAETIIGKLWETLYKEYFLGIKTTAGTTIPPIDSSLPFILISKDYTHLFIVFETKEGESIKIIQHLNID